MLPLDINKPPLPACCLPARPRDVGSVEAQIAYNMNNSRWFLNRTYAFEVHNADSSLRLRFGAINTNPFVTKYAKVSAHQARGQCTDFPLRSEG